MGRKSTKILKLPSRPIFGFAVEGDCEYDYLKIVLNVTNPHKVKNVQGGSEVVCVRQALDLLGNSEDKQIQKYGTHAYQHVFVVFDTDTMTQQKINDIKTLLAKDEKHSQKLKFIVSNQCFEYVLGLHFSPVKHPTSINSNKHMEQYRYEDHKSNPTRTKLMTDLKNAPDSCKAMYTSLKTRDSNLKLDANTPWVERIKTENDPNSNFYVVYDCLASHNLLPEALKPLE
ncbi:MAG: RloB family protein [Candidatus Melainabacteria bacterium]|jgi:hypothetical protein|nr:RloB family protein [Candidatus Melainabacteria bacterium]